MSGEKNKAREYDKFLFGKDVIKKIDQISKRVHDGYFSIDKKNNYKDTKGDTKDDKSTYDKIMKDKEKLISFDEELAVIFSHSALKEGWDNPNIFQLCALKDSNNQISIKQEIGRGLRICVNNDGDRIDFEKLGNDKDQFEKFNTLRVIARGTYEEFSNK